MTAALVRLVAGIGFLLLGRWMYLSPKKVYPNWLYNNPDSPLLKNAVKAFAMMLMFVGSYTVLFIIVASLLPEVAAFLLALLAAIAVTWFLRFRLKRAADTNSSGSAASTSARAGFLSKKGKWVLGISVAVALVFCVAIFAWLGNSEVCQLAFAQARSNSVVAQHLGEPVKRSWIMSGSIEESGPSGHADVAIPVSGPRGRGTLHAMATKSAGLWRFDTLELAVDGDPKRVDLLTSQRGQTDAVRP